MSEKIDEIDELVSLIDNFISSDGGHINVYFDGKTKTYIDKSKSLDCLNNTSCSTPTLFDGVDDSDK